MAVSYFVYLAASDGEEAIWAQMLVVVLLAAGGGIYAFIKTRPLSHKSRAGLAEANHNIVNRGIVEVSRFIQTVGRQIPTQRAGKNQAVNKTSQINDYTPAVTRAAIQPDTRQNRKAVLDTQPDKSPPLGTGKRDLEKGMELLDSGFLARVIEQAVDADGLKIEMQKMCFAELMRRRELAAISSEALRAYTLDKNNFYGKIIQRQAMEELFHRTGEKGS